MIKYVVFDFDGTIADTFRVMKEISKEEITGITDKDFEIVKEKGIKDLLKIKNIKLWQLPGMVIRVTSKLKNNENVKLFPKMISLIKTLRKSYKLGIVSSNSKDNIAKILKKNKIDNLFDFIYSKSSIFGKHRVLKRMCGKYGINPSEVIYIGDEDRDILAAKKTKIKTMAVTWGYNSQKRLKKVKPDYIANFPKEIIKILSRED